jgi:hypothetical protein
MVKKRSTYVLAFNTARAGGKNVWRWRCERLEAVSVATEDAQKAEAKPDQPKSSVVLL